MKYKVGDRVKIKTWQGMKKEFGNIGVPGTFIADMEEGLTSIPNRILTIKSVNDGFGRYFMVELSWIWSDEMIEGLAEREVLEVLDPIKNRFEILDLR